LTLALTSAVGFVVPALSAFIWSRARGKDTAALTDAKAHAFSADAMTDAS